MKKVLLATTALALMAGVAHAEVSLSGDARVGFVNVEGGDTTLERRARVKFSLSGETSNGLSFGASFRPQGAVAAEDGNANNTGNVYISGAFGTLSVGSESSAAEYAVGDLAGVGFTGAGAGNENTFTGGGSVVYTYSADALTAMVSVGESAGVGGKTLDADTLAMGVKYVAGAVTVAVGYEKGAADDHIIGGVTYAMGDTTVKATYGAQGDFSQMGASVAHAMGSVSLAGFYRSVDDAGVAHDADYYGVGVAYDLGGGAAAKVGFASNDDVNTVEAGMTFSF